MSSITKCIGVLLFLIIGTSSGETPAEPSVMALTQLLGRPISDSRVGDFVSGQGLQKYAKGDSGGYDRSGTATGSFKLLFGQNKIDRIILYVRARPEIASAYRGPLPLGVTAKDNAEVLIRRLGRATRQQVEADGDAWYTYIRATGCVTFALDSVGLYEIWIDPPESR